MRGGMQEVIEFNQWLGNSMMTVVKIYSGAPHSVNYNTSILFKKT